MRTAAATGFALVTLMFVVFFLTAAGRPFPYREVQVVATLGAVALVVGAMQGSASMLAAGFGVNVLTRATQIAMGLSRLPLALNVALAAGWIWACVQAARGGSVKGALWFLAFVHVASLVTALSRFEASVGLALGAAGLFLAAPNMGAEAARSVGKRE
ncbi:MAG TPA: hypothetical protein VM370_04440 [Candidatus Thermoplasmatota archaeon]|nr:hypothetical protein [Candidatus Thermoplasmatota archaeon]